MLAQLALLLHLALPLGTVLLAAEHVDTINMLSAMEQM
jgi:hypothetical protein